MAKKKAPDPVLFSPAEVGWLQEAHKRARRHFRAAERASAVGKRIVEGVLAKVVAGHRDALPRDGRWQLLRDGEGVPVGYQCAPPEEDEAPAAPPPKPIDEAAVLREVAAKEADEKVKGKLLAAAEAKGKEGAPC